MKIAQYIVFQKLLKRYKFKLAQRSINLKFILNQN